MNRSVAQPQKLDENTVDELDSSDAHAYGWRYAYESAPDGSEKLVQSPLTYADLLDPQEGDFIAESTVHQQLIHDLLEILTRRYRDEPTTAVWSDLKIAYMIPGLTTGPGPDLFVVEGVEDRDRQRRSFRFGEEPGEIRLVIEVVGRVEAPVELTDAIMPGVVSLPHGFGHHRPGIRLETAAGRPGVSLNDLTDEQRVDALCGNAAFSGVPVTVEAVD